MISNNIKKENTKNTKPKQSLIEKFILMYLIVSLSVFIIPEDILDRYEICNDFVEFMKIYFPNIEIFSNISALSQIAGFYTGIMWIAGILLIFGGVFYYVFYIFQKDKAHNKDDKFNILSLVFNISISIFAIYIYYTGYIATDGLSFGNKHIYIGLETRLGIFLPIMFFQFALSIFFMMMVDYISEFMLLIFKKIRGVSK
ncbi:hypothetical protein [Campylobacter sp. RM16188]|uniref:hypothetical protein n=1 Tax=Campylobacter sp. RM16188 TaxID=1705725 RepID=UPI001555D9F9|nr:hypothetical protein [Campylobacter sp. RM16188]